MSYAKVIVDINHSNVDRIFEYRVPEDMQLVCGQRVLVPFGAGNISVEGYVLELEEECSFDAARVKPIRRTLESGAILTAGQVALAKRIKEHYHTTLAVALRLMFPAQMRGQKIHEKTQRVLALSEGLDVNLAKRSFYTKSGKLRAPRQFELFSLIAEHGAVKSADLPEELRGAVAPLQKQGFLQVQLQEVYRQPFHLKSQPAAEFVLTEDQTRAVKRIVSGIGKAKGFLLHGVTGSGKTEVYIKAIEQALQAGKTAIMLVPEISLTPQLQMMFERRLKQPMAVLHSRLSAGERYDEWRRILSGQVRVVLGARSAIFAPLEKLGIVIIDEEHETSYKSDTHPKYLTHEIARMRAQIEGCAVVYASATPSIETYYRAKMGELEVIEMPKRLFNLSLPKMQVVDMREELKKGNRTMFSGKLYDEIQRTLNQKKQAMIFLNRRGYSTFVMCRGCGYVEYCDHCDVSMTYHKRSNTLKCHYCGRERPVRTVCPECGKPYLKYFGAGTQKVEEELKRLFPSARILRMDLDTVGKKDAYYELYEQFRAGKADILLGTQIISKGLDFENVRLVGIISADSSLRFPDYRSAERTFQQIEQVAGRAGRKEEGLVVTQSYTPEHYAITFAQKHDYRGFFCEELDYRQKLELPPFTDFVRILFSSNEEEIAQKTAEEFLSGLKLALDGFSLPLMEAGSAPVKRLENKTRYQILMKIRNDEYKEQIMERIYQYAAAHQYPQCVFGIEVNPLNLS